MFGITYLIEIAIWIIKCVKYLLNTVIRRIIPLINGNNIKIMSITSNTITYKKGRFSKLIYIVPISKYHKSRYMGDQMFDTNSITIKNEGTPIKEIINIIRSYLGPDGDFHDQQCVCTDVISSDIRKKCPNVHEPIFVELFNKQTKDFETLTF